jgi:hypothetical protein
VPHIVTVLVWVLRVLKPCGVSPGDEVSSAAVLSARCVPQYLGGATVVHGRGPDGQDGVRGVQSTIIKQCLVLLHSGVEWNIIVLHPATEGVQQKYGVLVTELKELLSGILEQNYVSIVEGVAELEGVHGISSTGNNLVVDLPRSLAVAVEAIVEQYLLHKAHAGARD